MRQRTKRQQSRSVRLQELEVKLAEAVETLEAIRSGAVDALVVHAPQGEQIFTLKGADQVYRTLVEAMNEGAVSLGSDHTVLFCNGRFAEMIQTPLEKIIGAAFPSFIVATEKQPLAGFLRSSLNERGTCESALVTGSGNEVTVLLSANPVPLSKEMGLSLVVTDITARKQLENAQREIARRIVTAQEHERLRVSRELHDGINQLLSSARTRLHAIENRLAGVQEKSVRAEITETRDLLEKTIREVRRISRNLRPSELDDLGLVAALHSLADDFRKRTEIAVRVESELTRPIVDKHAELAVYRIVQEAFNNIERHARASRVSLSLSQNDGELNVRIRDNGQGFNMRRVEDRGFGLANMKERARQTGGRVSWRSTRGAGTEVALALPV